MSRREKQVNSGSFKRSDGSNNTRKRKSSSSSSRKDGKEEAAAASAAAAADVRTPTFELPFDANQQTNVNSKDGRFELWTIRLPASVNVQDLNGREITLPQNSSQSSSSSGSPDNNSNNNTANQFASSSTGQNYTFQWGQAVENESFRLLLRNKNKKDKDNSDDDDDSSDDDDDDDDDDEASDQEDFLYPAPMGFARHVNVVSVLQPPPQGKADDNDVADAADKLIVKRRPSYAPVPQRMGLKRRWQHPGAQVPAQKVEAIQQECQKIQGKKRAPFPVAEAAAAIAKAAASPAAKRSQTKKNHEKNTSGKERVEKTEAQQSVETEDEEAKKDSQQQQRQVAVDTESPIFVAKVEEATTNGNKVDHDTHERAKHSKKARKEAKKAKKEAKRAKKKKKAKQEES